MYIILSLLLSILTCYVGIKEMKAYASISANLRKCIYLYPLLLIGIFYSAGNTYFSLFFGAITPILISHFIIDIKEQELPNLSNLIILILGLLRLFCNFAKAGFSTDLLPILGGYLLTGALLFAIYLIIAVITGGAIGGGDIKLVGALGIFFPSEMFIKLLIYPIFLGAIFAIGLLISKKGDKNTKFAFGPAIILAFYLITII